MNLQDFIEYLSESFGSEAPNSIATDTKFQELEDFGSLTVLEIIALAKTKFAKTINGKEIRNCQTIEELFNLISSK